MPTASSPTAEAGYSNLIARTISTQFSTRPTLRSVTASLLKEDLLEKYPPLDFDPERTRLAQPLPEGGWRLTLLLDVVLEYLANGTPPLLSAQYGRACFLTNKAPTHLTYDNTTQREPDMQVIAGIIRELPVMVCIAFQEALSDYWNEPVEGGVSRWQWLGDLLNGVLKTTAVRHAQINALQAGILTELTRHSDKHERLQAPWAKGVIHAYVLETTLIQDQQSISLQSPDLLVTCGETLLLCGVTGTVEAFPSMEAFGQAWGMRSQQTFMAVSITWKRFEPDGNLFDTQAALLLNRQLDDLAAFKLPSRLRVDELEKRFAAITDVAAQFVIQPSTQSANPMLFQHIDSSLPKWLQTASAVDRMAYRKHVLELASIKQQNLGRTFRAGIDDLPTFARKALHKQMLLDQPQAPGYNPDELELTFHVPVGDLGSGYIEPVKMSLTELSIKNLAAKPKGRMTIRHTGDQLIQDWTTEAYLLELVSRVDIGQHYPEYIRTELLADTPEARERQRLFSLELAVSLPILALELSIKAEQGFSRQGYRYVAALMHKTTAERFVDDQEIVLRPLAFQRKADAECDVAGNLFIIEPRNLNADGPHILYRPLYSPALQQYPTRQALLSAIAQPGPLQTSVLTWLSDRARPIYDNNGFNEPHIVHFHVDDEFTPPEKPKPAILVGDEAADWLTAPQHGELLARLFESNANALAEQADRQSVSNAESRWAIILEGGWLVFNNLILPLLRGPAMLVGWMLQITHSLVQDLPALDSDDVTAREQAWVDVLLNLGLVLLHVAQNRDAIDGPMASQKPPVALDSLRRPLPHVVAESRVTQAAPGLPSEPPGSGHTLLDFNLSTARDSATARLVEQLKSVRVPWPDSLPEPIAIGPFHGLYRIDNKWHATLAGLLFRVRIVPGFGEVFLVPPDHPDHPGIKLKSNGRGKWTLDQGLQLVGGGRKSRIADARETRRQRIEELALWRQEFFAQQDRVQKRVDIAENLMDLKDNNPSSTDQERTTFMQRYVAELDKQTDNYITLLDGLRETSELTDFPLDHSLICDVLGNIIKNIRKRIVKADDARTAANIRYNEFASNVQQLYEALANEGEAVVRRYFEFIRETSEINETMIRSYEEIDRRIEELEQIPLLGAETLNGLNQDRPENELTALRVKSYQLVILRILSVKTLGTETTDALEIAVEPLLMLARSHAELQTDHVYERSDRIAVLDSLVRHYSAAQDALGSIAIFRAEELVMPAFNRLRILIHQLRLDAEQRMAAEIQQLASEQGQSPDESGQTAAGSSKDVSSGKKKSKTPPPAVSRKKVIKTAKGTLIGDLRPRIANQDGDIVDINGPLDDKPLLSFHQHDNDWVEIVEARAPAPKAPSIPYPLLKGNARKALAQVDEQVLKIDGYAKGASSPKEIEEQLQREAQKLTGYADKLEKHEDAPTGNEKDTALITALRDKAHILERKGTELRTRMTQDQAPTSEGVEYLLQHNVIHVEPIGRRVRLKTGRRDFMQEYALLDADDSPLWYAHFHYVGVRDGKATYTTAHLKTGEQRFESYESIMARAKDPKQKIEIYHGAISETLAREYFLPLEPN
ncbi:dermonecrotic toxin domain-containing protein [Pseudomonas sp. NPDC096950]|uniref:dermonecrotic toxin domain-containing protein n=1 Tax=Pseudomonas sp. NPDC096950 TaxID=3364485 RepID=UPI00383AA204